MKNEYVDPEMFLEEQSMLSKSIAQVETAIPAFIGFTRKAVFNGQDFHHINKIQPLEVNSFTDYEKIFGEMPQPALVEVGINDNNKVEYVSIQELSFMYHSVKLFFENGGGTCLIVSVGSYTQVTQSEAKNLLIKGLETLEKYGAPTLLVVPDGAVLNYEEAAEVHAAMITQCGRLKNRFAILDLTKGNEKLISPDNPVAKFRMHITDESLSYGAAYYPRVRTNLFHKADGQILMNAKYLKKGKIINDLSELFGKETLETLRVLINDPVLKFSCNVPASRFLTNRTKIDAFAASLYSCFKVFYNLQVDKQVKSDYPVASVHAAYTAEGTDFHRLLYLFYTLVNTYSIQLESANFFEDFSPLILSAGISGDEFEKRMGRRTVSSMLKLLAKKTGKVIARFLSEMEKLHNHMIANLRQRDDVFQNIVDAYEKQKIVVPPGGAVAGIYSRIDRERGVWKPPANVNLNAVEGPAVVVTEFEQENLNKDVVAGKYVNVIRQFAGRSTLIWGARTLAGNDNEWRYVSVRRFAIMIEQSVLEATSQFVFEPNELSTWMKVKNVIENFLYSLWREGAMPGIKPEHAFFVKTGLGQTMTASDIQDDLMITEIGFSAVRPAEFNVIRIVHKMMQKN